MTEGPPDPIEPPEPIDDPMLDALESSIEEPPGLEDPLAGRDGLAVQLDAAEAWMDDTPLSRPAYEADLLADPSIPPADEAIEPEIDPTEDPSDGSDTVGQEPSDNQPGMDSGLRGTGGVRPPMGIPLSSRRPTDVFRQGRAADRLGPYRSIGRSGRSSVGRKNQTLALCLDSHELIYSPRDCESCEKFRHWPEGTNQEPRQCWHDWQVLDWLEGKKADQEEVGE